MATPTGLPSHAQVLSELVQAEKAEGWMARCEQAGRYLVLNTAFVAALARVLKSLGEAPVLEVCAGSGSLAQALRECGIEVVATDADPPTGFRAQVQPWTAEEALRRHPSRVVLGSFVPVDAGVDRRVLDDFRVRHYLVLNACLDGVFGPRCIWTHAGWTRTPLDEVTRWMVTRHDVWLSDDLPLLSHGEAWLLSRIGPTGHESGTLV